MTAFDLGFADRAVRLNSGFLPSSRPARSRLLTPLGWFIVLAILTMAAGAALGFAA